MWVEEALCAITVPDKSLVVVEALFVNLIRLVRLFELWKDPVNEVSST